LTLNQIEALTALLTSLGAVLGTIYAIIKSFKTHTYVKAHIGSHSHVAGKGNENIRKLPPSEPTKGPF
jgi:hypothetical protein